jgi:membrane-associated phospholipid phosphatase
VPRGGARIPALVAGVGCLVLFVTLALAVVQRWQPLLDVDRRIGAWPQDFTARHDWARETWIWIGRLSSGWVLVPVLVVAVGWLWHRGRRPAAAWVALVMTTVLVTNPLVKQLVGRDRPRWDDPIRVIASPAFPSGHAANNAAVAGIVVVLALRWVRSRRRRRTTVVGAVLGALLVGADRVFLGVHHLSDVLGGYLLAVTVGLLGLAVVDPAPPPGDRRAATNADGTAAGR